jgi:hypothetical protein
MTRYACSDAFLPANTSGRDVVPGPSRRGAVEFEALVRRRTARFGANLRRAADVLEICGQTADGEMSDGARCVACWPCPRVGETQALCNLCSAGRRCNMGKSQTARASKQASRQAVGRASSHHVRGCNVSSQLAGRGARGGSFRGGEKGQDRADETRRDDARDRGFDRRVLLGPGVGLVCVT